MTCWALEKDLVNEGWSFFWWQSIVRETCWDSHAIDASSAVNFDFWNSTRVQSRKRCSAYILCDCLGCNMLLLCSKSARSPWRHSKSCLAKNSVIVKVVVGKICGCRVLFKHQGLMMRMRMFAHLPRRSLCHGFGSTSTYGFCFFYWCILFLDADC